MRENCENELARAYVPSQRIGELYSGYEGLKKGTIFPELYRPYGDDKREGRCLYE